MAIASVNGIDLFHQVVGTGQPIVFAHGGGATHLHWWRQVAYFSGHYTCVVFDQRGHGRSGGSPADPGLERHHRDLEGLLDHLGIERAVLVGHSMGGLAVSGLAQRAPERVAGLVMAATPFGFFTPALSEWSTMMIDKILRGFDVLAHCVSPRFAREQPELFSLRAQLGALNEPRPGPRGLDAYETFRDTPPGDYRDFPVPTLFIAGEEDTLTRPWLLQATAAAIGGARYVELPRSGHSVQMEQAALFNDALLRFMVDLHEW